MVHRTDTRRRMLDSAAELFCTQGYHATGLTQLVAAGRAPKGSLYFHFPGGKEQLAAEAVRLSGERLGEQFRELTGTAPDPATGLDRIIDVLAAALAGSGFRGGCPIATVALEAGESEPIRTACDEGYSGWIDGLSGYFAGHGLSEDRAQSLATVVISAIEGALLLARTRRDVAPLRAVAEHLRATVEREFS
ncbi:TetR/AcrR family transcriptional regulator [Amycolatopsis jiangsuensis]|uniref:TetR/AcrR family transcriptional repressor of lmrAB and yxaGH operons n=1 Tax=Amycolatopsis jiangsuensis TaxID=1181879 RepID=A0A840J1W5_9PSEU|nr:TetR/AcrR family transcriptional regulator [Amycolatopsis jiangsuensis]MBB4688050.1 TetR/AcrR family transcriptional repressor of lmrAB and yxaGH operons [Amycolatopsis jiangsuensis]